MVKNYSTISTKQKLSFFWIFAIVNYIFCDVFTLFHSESLAQLLTGEMGGMLINESFLLGFAILMELPMMMILLSLFLPYKSNRIANITIGILMTIVQASTLFGENTLHYIFFSIIEIATTMAITWIAFNWSESEA